MARRAKPLTRAQVKELLLFVANKVHDGQLAPLRSTYERERPHGTPGGLSLLRMMGYQADANGWVGPWAKMVTDITSLPVATYKSSGGQHSKEREECEPTQDLRSDVDDEERNRGLEVIRVRSIPTGRGTYAVHYMLR